MKYILIACLFLAGCNSSGFEPTAIQFGDSVTIGIGAETRHDLCGVVDFRHDQWKNGDIPMCGADYSSYAVGQFVSHSQNNGRAIGDSHGMQKQLSGAHYNVILITAGQHDYQNTDAYPLIRQKTLDDLYQAMETEAVLAEQHADVVIWVDAAPKNQLIYHGADYVNPLGESVAREHGFYIANIATTQDYHLPWDVHFTREGYQVMGQILSDCVITALSGGETDTCHH